MGKSTEHKCRVFNVYDAGGHIRRQVDAACEERDISRSQLIRHALRQYFASEKSA